MSAVLLILAGIAAYHNSFSCPFLLDDKGAILENVTIRSLWPLSAVLSEAAPPGIAARPLVGWSLALNYALGGLNVWGYHAFNLAVHVLAALTLFGIARRTLELPSLPAGWRASARPVAFAIALLWLVHPLHTSCVTYITQRSESMMGLLCLVTLYCAIRGAGSLHPARWHAAAVFACALGMASKPVMAAAPLAVFLYDRTFLSGSFREAWRARRRLYLGLGLTWVLLAVLLAARPALNAGFAVEDHSALEYLASQPGVILHYLRLVMWPAPLVFYYAWPVARTMAGILPPALALATLAGATFWSLRRRPALGFLGGWFFLMLVPSSSVIPIGDLAFEHRMYLALISPVALFVAGVRAWCGPRRRLMAASVVGVAALACLALTIRRNHDYRSALAIWQDTVAKRPHSTKARMAVADLLIQQGRGEEAVAQYRIILDMKPDEANNYNNLGAALIVAGKPEEAVATLRAGLRLDPAVPGMSMNLAVALEQLGRLAEAADAYKRELELGPDRAQLRFTLGNVLMKQSRFAEAAEQYRAAVRLRPDSAAARQALDRAVAAASP